MRRYDLYVHGEWRPPAAGEYVPVIDPSTGVVFAEVASGGAEDVAEAVESAVAGQAVWHALGAAARGRVLHRVAAILRSRVDELAALESCDAGQAFGYARHVVTDIAARRFEYYAGLGETIGGRTVPMPGHFDYTLREPLGVTAHITPWNGPLWVGTRSIVPALAAGNSVVLKPGEEALLTMLELAAIATEAGMPPGVLNVVPGTGPAVGSPLVANEAVAAVAFTGSLSTGRQIMRLAAAGVKPVLLELGGKSAHIVFDDADLEQAADWAVRGIFWGAGQICVAGSRLLVQASRADDFRQLLKNRVEALRIAPAIESPDMGPLISEAHLSKVQSAIDAAQAEGATLAAGGSRIRERGLDRGFFMAPTIFENVSASSRLFAEEIFGPVLAITTFQDEPEAVELANATRFGLAAGIWTARLGRAHRVASAIKAGSIYINRYFSAGVEAPAGGYRQSGFGRLDGIEALDEFTQIKNVTINLQG